MRWQHFHPDREEKKPPRIVLQRKKSVSIFDDHKDRMGQVVILTTEGIEYDIIQTHINDLCEGIYQGIIYTYGIFYAYKQGWNVSIIEIGGGGDSASFQAEQAVNYFHPDVILIISTAHGIQNVQTGDVVSATEIYAYEANKSGVTFQAERTIWNVNANMEQRARAEAERVSWLQRIRGNAPVAITPRVVFAPVASGKEEMTPMHSQVFTLLQANYENTLAVEMNGYELLQAARANQGIDTLVVCGITDTIQEQSIHSENRRRVAAEHASAFAFEVLARLESKRPSQSIQKTETLSSSDPPEAIEVFYSYIDTDTALVEMLQQHLVMLKRTGQISDWYAGKITAGGDVHEHQQHLEAAQIILMLISPEYIASDHHYSMEVKRALERDRAGSAKVVPILLRPTSNLNDAGFDRLQIIPKNGEALTQSKDLDQAFKEVAHEIKEIVKVLRSKG